MENATKALLIAAALFLAVMLLALLVGFGGDLSRYFTAQHEAKVLQQLVEFNNKFENYNGQTIRGNELISIMNRIIDYNNYQNGIEGYERIRITIDLKGHQNELKYRNETTTNSIITGAQITNVTNDDAIAKVASLSSNLVSSSGITGITDTKLQKMSAEIANIVDDSIIDSRAKEEYIAYRKQLLKRILGYEVQESSMANIKKSTYQYYQYTQFKRAMFKCTNIFHDTTTGRVESMTFDIVLENDKIKFD